MNIAEIESSLRELVDEPFDPGTFIYRFLEIYDAPKATITKLRQAAPDDRIANRDVVWKKKLFFRVASEGQAAATVDAMASDPRIKKDAPRFLLATDGVEVYAYDRKREQPFDSAYDKLNDAFDFFLPLAGIERYEGVAENPADIKATGRLAKLYDAILEANPDWVGRDHTHELNLFMTRLLFCFFAEDTSIFKHGVFTTTVMTLTNDDGSDTASLLQTLFTAMNTPDQERGEMPEYARRFPFVNGGLFRETTPIPRFSKRARRLLKDCGALSWRDINPDIFGSMIQAVVEPGMRGDMGMHYTSVPNIMKVLQPLFLLSLEEEFEAARDNMGKLQKLLQRIYNIRVFDPACGSGNFLIIAYRELRKLESRIFECQKAMTGQSPLFSSVRLTQFYGIELADFAVETAKLSLWITEYQMNELFKAEFGQAAPSLPLRDSGNIVHGNAAGLNWLDVCAIAETSETYVVGNPPYAGSVYQTDSQKDDMAHVFAPVLATYKDLDYVAAWLFKGASYCRLTNAQCAFVTTNSICQGEQVAMLWPLVFGLDIEIAFAHQSFKWRNNASNNAAVTCIVVGIRPRQKAPKTLYSGDIARTARNIGPYLIEMDDIVVRKRTKPLGWRSVMVKGNQPSDDGNLLFSPDDRVELLNQYPEAARFLRRFYGSQEFIKGIERWCLWLDDSTVDAAREIPPIAERLRAVQRFRLEGKSKQSRDNAGTPYRFAYAPHKDEQAIIVPRVASERRQFTPIGLLPSDVIISDNAYAIYGAEDYLLAVLASRIHTVWLAAVGGRMKTDYRYSNTLVYNTFPIPELSDDQKEALETHTVEILVAREAHPGKTIAWLYDPKTMPANLLQAHNNLDETLETIYIGRRFRNDTERLEHLFKIYATMIKKEQACKVK